MTLIRIFASVKLTIIIPVYRVEATLNRCVESVVMQDFRDFELILVDDGSPDNCPQMCDTWADRDERIRVIHQENSGLSQARNAGIEIAQGDYITFIDSDDFIGAQTFEHLIDYLANHPETDILEYPAMLFCGSPQQQKLAFPIEKVYHNMMNYWYQGRAYEHSYAWNKLYRRELFHEVRFPAGVVFEDICTLYKLLEHTRILATINKGCYYYCYNPNGITATADAKELRMQLMNHIGILRQTERRDRYYQLYYMRVLNIQLDLYNCSGDVPMMREVYLNPKYFKGKDKIKAILLNTLGIKRLCIIFRKIPKRWKDLL